MLYIDSPGDLQWYRENLGDVWQSATLTFSSVEVNGVQIPNGELSFSRKSGDEGAELLYQEGPLSIYEVVSNSPIDLLEQILNGEIPTNAGSVEIDSELGRHTTGNYFQAGIRDSRVRETRPQMEVNAAVHIDILENVEDRYSKITNELDDELMRAEEPYYDLGRCEGYYFDYIFHSDRENPAILLFAELGMEFSINESDTLEVISPTSLFENMFVSVLPQRPYDEHKGWRIEFDEGQLESLDDGRSRYTENLELDGIDEMYAALYLEDRSVKLVEHNRSDTVPENPRYEIMQAFDQNGNLEEYLEGYNADYFEVAVVNALSTAGWLVQWYGDDSFVIPSFSEDVPGAQYQEIDIVAYHPENTVMLCIECTNQDISEKEQILDRTEAISSVLSESIIPTATGFFDSLQPVPCVATPQKPEELNDEVVSGFKEKGIKVLHSERLKAIYAASQGATDTVDADTPLIDVM